MVTYLIRRIVAAIVLLFVVSVITFSIFYLVPRFAAATPESLATRYVGRTADVETMQRTLAKLGLYKDKVDGKAGMLTRSALGAYQKANNLKVDCWPTANVLSHMQSRSAN